MANKKKRQFKCPVCETQTIVNFGKSKTKGYLCKNCETKHELQKTEKGVKIVMHDPIVVEVFKNKLDL